MDPSKQWQLFFTLMKYYEATSHISESFFETGQLLGHYCVFTSCFSSSTEFSSENDGGEVSKMVKTD